MRTAVNACDCTKRLTDILRESALKVDSGRKQKIPWRTRESNLRQQLDFPTLPTDLHPHRNVCGRYTPTAKDRTQGSVSIL